MLIRSKLPKVKADDVQEETNKQMSDANKGRAEKDTIKRGD